MTSLTQTQFLGQALDVVLHANQKWLTAEQVGLALGYAADRARDSITTLYRRHADEFTDQDTCTINLMAQVQMREMRIFSATGCQLLGFFANTARAKQFRQWAKTVLAQQAVVPQPPTPAATPTPPAPQKVRANRVVERQAFEMFVAGWSQNAIAKHLKVSHAVINLMLHGRYQFSPFAGTPECSEALINAVAQRHLEVERERILAQHQRLANKLRHTSNNQLLATKLDSIGQQLQNNILLSLEH